MDHLFENMSTTLLRPTTPIDLASRRATWLHAARACATQVTRWLKPTALLLALAMGGLAAVPEAQAGDFGYRKPITIERTKVGNVGMAATTLPNYPMLFSVTDVNLRTFASDPVNGRVQQTDGAPFPNTKPFDIIFRALDTTTCGGPVECTLDHEIESYDPATGKLIAWVRIPVLNTISASSNTKIYIYYGASTVTASTECLPPFTNCTGVWDANFKGVWHVKEDPSGTAPQIKDSTTNANHGTSAGAMITADQVDAKIDKGLDFDGTDDKISIPDPASGVLDFGLLGNFTISLWVKPTGTQTQYDRILAKQAGGTYALSAGYSLSYDNNNSYILSISDGGNNSCVRDACPGVGRTLGPDWNHLVMVIDRPGARIRSYLNGVLDLDSGIPGTVTNIDNTQPLAFAAASTGTVNSMQVLDEVRISNVVRSADWIETEFNNVDAPGGLGPTTNTWSAVGSGVGNNNSAQALAVYKDALYVGGSFTNIGGVATNYLAKWNGTTWSAVPNSTLNSAVYALAVYKGELYVGGNFSNAGNNVGGGACDLICKWDGTNWSALGTGIAPAATTVYALAVYNNQLYVGGLFTNAGGVAGADRIAKWNGSIWSLVGAASAVANNQVNALAVYNNQLYLGGTFTSAGPTPPAACDSICSWNGAAWSALTTGTNNGVSSLAAYKDALYVGGNFTLAGGVANTVRIAKWNGAWSALGTGITTAGSTVSALSVYCGELYVGGSFTTVNGVGIQYIARWNGTTWSNVGSNTALNNTVRALAAYNGDLYVGGFFTNASYPYIAKWTGTCFYICGTELSNPPSLVKLTKASALSHDGVENRVVQLKWRTSYEVDHLGFHVYREQNGARLRVTPALVAGSALKAGAKTVLTAGQGYSWWDVLPAGGGPLAYWLEEIDLHGQRTWHGPIAVESAKGQRLAAEPERVRSVLLKHMGRGKKASVTAVPWYGTRQASEAAPTPEQLAVQWRLAAGLAWKLGVQAEGWYRVSQAELVAAGVNPKVNPRQLHLYAEGVEVPLLVTGEQDGRFDASDAIEFYGLGLDTPWTDTRTYWLVEEPRAGKRVGGEPSRQTGSLAPVSFPSTQEWRPRSIYFAALLNGEADNYFGPVVGNWPTDQEFTLAHLDPSPVGEAGLEVTLQGVTDGLHQVDVQLNGSSVGTVTFTGMAQGTTRVSLPQAQLQEGANVVTLVALGGEMDISLVAAVRLTAWRTYEAEAEVLEAPVRGGDQVTIRGFSSAQIRVLDVTQPDAVQAVSGRVKREKTGFAVTVVAPGADRRILLAFTEGSQARLASLDLNHPTQWHESVHQADLVILTHGSLFPSLATLQAWRQQQGWAVALIDVQDAYDEFTFGAKSPWALRALLQQARSHWARPPRFLLLAGDASFDPRNFEGMGNMDVVPTKLVDTRYLETASDDWFGDLDQDGVPEIAVGRLAVQTSEEAATVVQKLIDYDRAGAGARAAVLVADHNDGFDFEAASGQVKALLPANVTVEEIYRGQMEDARAALLASLNGGPWLVNYFGHGSVEVWQGGLLSSEDARTLTNGGRLPFVVAMTCLNGFFHDLYTESLAETLQKASQGGAVAVWASSALTDAGSQVGMNTALVQRLGEGLTLGEATAHAKAAASDSDVRRTWILFGDPTTRLH
jgi:hypothetical protein